MNCCLRLLVSGSERGRVGLAKGAERAHRRCALEVHRLEVLSELVAVDLVWALLSRQLLPEALDVGLLEALGGQGVHSFLEDCIRDGRSSRPAEIQEKGKDGVTAGEGRSNGIFELDLELVTHIEGPEGVPPVVQVKEALLVRVQLREELLDERLGQIKSIEGLFTL